MTFASNPLSYDMVLLLTKLQVGPFFLWAEAVVGVWNRGAGRGAPRETFREPAAKRNYELYAPFPFFLLRAARVILPENLSFLLML